MWLTYLGRYRPPNALYENDLGGRIWRNENSLGCHLGSRGWSWTEKAHSPIHRLSRSLNLQVQVISICKCCSIMFSFSCMIHIFGISGSWVLERVSKFFNSSIYISSNWCLALTKIYFTIEIGPLNDPIAEFVKILRYVYNVLEKKSGA